MKNKVCKTVALACFVFALAGNAWATGNKEQTQTKVISKYRIATNQGNKTTIDLTLSMLFESGSYYLSFPETYTKFAMGCQNAEGKWYLWQDNAWRIQVVNSASSLFMFEKLNAALPAPSNATTSIYPLLAEDSVGSTAFETGLFNVILHKGSSLPNNSPFLTPLTQGIADQPLPTAFAPITDADGLTGNIVVILLTKTGRGDTLVFKRKQGVFAGETELFHSTAALKPVLYKKKALALMYEFLRSKGTQADANLYKNSVASLYSPGMSDTEWEMFAGTVIASRETVFSALSTVIGTGLAYSYRNTSLGTSVFGDTAKGISGKSLYGPRKSIYLDSYLAFCALTGRPVFASLIQTENPGILYDPDQYAPIQNITGSNEGRELAMNAMRFYTWGVEYSHVKSLNNRYEDIAFYEGSMVYKDIKNSWFNTNTNKAYNYWPGALANSITTLPVPKPNTGKTITLPILQPGDYYTPFTDGKSGYPLPYAKNGIDSPRTFAYKMHSLLQARIANSLIRQVDPNTTLGASVNSINGITVNNYNYLTQSGSFLPGGTEGMLYEIGVDEMGLLTGSIAMSSFYDKIYDIAGNRPAYNLDRYYAMNAAGVGLDSNGRPVYDKAAHPPQWAQYRLKPTDLEKTSVVIPDLSMIELGDLIVRFGKEGTNSFTQVGIVVGLPQTKPAFGSDPGNFRSQVVVLSAREGFTQVTLGTWGNPVNGFGAFTSDPDSFHVRRLLKRKAAGQDGTFAAKGWDVCDVIPSSFPVTVREMKEQERVGGEGVVERWIPNTGEYLLLSDIRLNAQNRAGTKLDARYFAGEGNEVFITGAYDRGFAEGNTSGNIYNNSGCNFEVSLVPTDRSKDAVRLGLLVPGAIVDGKKTYTMNVEVSALYTSIGGHNRHASNLTQFQKNRLYLTSSGKIEGVVNGVAGYVLGIRPESAAAARPGDDMVLSFGLRARGANTAYEFTYTMGNNALRKTVAVGTMSEADYLAVYDKKMLWRANLYIDEAEAALGGLDWNDAHPWNAPPASGARDESLNPAYGKTTSDVWDGSRWGYNEWNRVHDGTASEITPITGLANLPPGNGKQVIQFTSFTPVRTLTDAGGTRSKPSNTNVITGTVAYSYPNHFSEPKRTINSDNEVNGWLGSAGSMDSPFDYNKKMEKQLSLLANWYNSSGKRFERSRLDWPTPNATAASAFESWSQYKACVTGATNARGIISAENFEKLERNSANWTQVYELSAVLGSWNRTTPPEDRWWYYIVQSPTENWTTSEETNAFVPSLGLAHVSQIGPYSTDYDEISKATEQASLLQAFLHRDYVIEAGTDCVGFAQRAASWDDNTYVWWDLNKGWTEQNEYGGESNIWTQLNSYVHASPSGRQYPRDITETSETYINAYLIVDHEVNGVYSETFLEKLRSVVPGDIWVKESSNNPAGGIKQAHIAIIAYVPKNAYELDAVTLLNQIILIEGEFTNKIQSVIKKLSVGMYDGEGATYGLHIYPGFSIPDGNSKLLGNQSLSLNCSSWAIRRLK